MLCILVELFASCFYLIEVIILQESIKFATLSSTGKPI